MKFLMISLDQSELSAPANCAWFFSTTNYLLAASGVFCINRKTFSRAIGNAPNGNTKDSLSWLVRLLRRASRENLLKILSRLSDATTRISILVFILNFPSVRHDKLYVGTRCVLFHTIRTSEANFLEKDVPFHFKRRYFFLFAC